MSNELKHYGIPGMVKGKRRFQNEDGTLTAAGIQRYLDDYHKNNQRSFKKLGGGKKTETTQTAAPQKTSTKKAKATKQAAAPQEKVTAEKITKVNNSQQTLHNAKGDVGVRKEKELKGEGASIMEQPGVNDQASQVMSPEDQQSAMAQQQLNMMQNAITTANTYNDSHPNGPFMVLAPNGAVSYTRNRKEADAAVSTFSSTTLANQQKMVKNLSHSEINDYLEHHGILGQKWGRRRYQYEDGSLTPEGRRHYDVGPERERAPRKTRDERHEDKIRRKYSKYSDDYVKYKVLSSKKRSQLSNEELDWLNQRLIKENNVRTMSRTSVSNGKAFLVSLADKKATDFVTKLADKAVDKLIDNIIDKSISSYTDKHAKKEKDKKEKDKKEKDKSEDSKEDQKETNSEGSISKYAHYDNSNPEDSSSSKSEKKSEDKPKNDKKSESNDDKPSSSSSSDSSTKLTKEILESNQRRLDSLKPEVGLRDTRIPTDIRDKKFQEWLSKPASSYRR